MAEFVVFWIAAPLALGAAISMLFMRNAVHAALLLVVNFFAIAVLYAVLEAQFLATIQIIVYAGAIMVLFLFVLMLLGVHRDDPGGGALRRQAPAAVVLGIGLFVLLAVAVGGQYLSDDDACPTEARAQAPADQAPPIEEEPPGSCAGLADANGDSNVRAVGLELFTRYVWPFEVTSILLIVAAIGALVIGRKTERPEDLVDRLDVPRPSPRPDGGDTPEAAPSARGGDEAPSDAGDGDTPEADDPALDPERITQP